VEAARAYLETWQARNASCKFGEAVHLYRDSKAALGPSTLKSHEYTLTGSFSVFADVMLTDISAAAVQPESRPRPRELPSSRFCTLRGPEFPGPQCGRRVKGVTSPSSLSLLLPNDRGGIPGSIQDSARTQGNGTQRIQMGAVHAVNHGVAVSSQMLS
jgi:hypothetical protein